ncbi:MAG: hypothetical protein COZ98_05990 [Candidatus Omnitrophica bacterium CG_4_8_14_3_um_filter_43_15]|nr:MAG: hypothetical protein COU52_04880 [Candidatus Omnitrophica bacterium CG10_big_fil_rev_8_21_14_0_10_43_8]PIW79731.1 MAG: hypothetical protein COZ98_05990 [Candidatus Omnitrophica bacterium CG_4_8_14_3_um_filter_43_15]PJC46273.1 MAG: hypothetical protein CO036_03690 [Candidatus Omnitrophica bacterium CG_4_9_14_0_2_um_filter_43_12]
MRKAKFLIPVIIIVFIAGIAVSSGVYRRDLSTKNQSYADLDLVGDVAELIETNYVDKKSLDFKKLAYGALRGMVSTLDHYSQFLDPDEYKDIKVETKGEFGGVGIEIAVRDGLLIIIAPIDGTPADKVGLAAGDKIVKIDGESVKDISIQDAVKKLRGKPGTSVEISVLREDEKKILDFTITRAIIKVASIKEARIVDSEYKIGYIKLVEFQEKTSDDFEAGLIKLKSKGMNGLILDLRNNPGGLLESAVGVAEKFLQEGEVIVFTKGSQPTEDMVFKSTEGSKYLDFPIIVLVNKGSASASEIVAGAIQDHKRGLILGANTFGKASVQTVIPLRDGSALRLTTAMYYTPLGKIIHERGIFPDIVVERKDEKDPYDNQLEQAIDLLKK